MGLMGIWEVNLVDGKIIAIFPFSIISKFGLMM